MLREAQQGGYAVPGFNVQTLEMLQGAVQAAEAERSPVILQFNPGNIAHIGMEYAAAMALAAARQACVPVVVHLDHGLDFAQTVQAMRMGFTSVMYDGTPFPFAQNLAVTRQVCEMARAAGLSVEGEIGQRRHHGPDVRRVERRLAHRPTHRRRRVADVDLCAGDAEVAPLERGCPREPGHPVLGDRVRDAVRPGSLGRDRPDVDDPAAGRLLLLHRPYGVLGAPERASQVDGENLVELLAADSRRPPPTVDCRGHIAA